MPKDNDQNGEDIKQREQSKRNNDEIAGSKFGASGIHIRGPSSRGGKEVGEIDHIHKNTAACQSKQETSTSIKWFDLYLTNRFQITIIGSTVSKELKLNLGIPQGAILSPTIFMILVSDLQL